MRGSTFERIQQEIAEGKLGIARDRLHGLVQAHPLDLSLRSMLGDVNWKLGYPREAGRFWFLDSDPGPEKMAAIALFVEECDNDPAKILRRLKLRTDPGDIVEVEVREMIERLVAECIRMGKPVPNWPPAEPQTRKEYWFGTCCAGVAILILALAVIGGISVWNWMF